MIGASVNLSILNGGLVRAQIAEAKANLDVLKFNEEALRQNIALQVRQAALNVQQAAESIGVAREGRAAGAREPGAGGGALQHRRRQHHRADQRPGLADLGRGELRPGAVQLPDLRRRAGERDRQARWRWSTSEAAMRTDALSDRRGGTGRSGRRRLRVLDAAAQTTARTGYVTETLDRGPVTATVTATGTVNPVTTVQVGTYVSGPIIAIDVDFNSRVQQGPAGGEDRSRAVPGQGAERRRQPRQRARQGGSSRAPTWS